jgi:hypothetical protein
MGGLPRNRVQEEFGIDKSSCPRDPHPLASQAAVSYHQVLAPVR